MTTLADVFLPDTLVIRTTISADKQVATTIVQSLLVQLAERPKPPTGDIPIGTNLGDSPIVDSRSASFFLKLASDEGSAELRIRIMGNAELQSGSRGALVSRIAGHTFLDELAPPDGGGDFEFSHDVTVTPKNGLLVTLFLVVDREIAKGALGAAFASVTSVEFSADLSGKTGSTSSAAR
jgi:hypothetical protein